VFLAALARMLPRDRRGSVFVRPETIRRWHRSLLARPLADWLGFQPEQHRQVRAYGEP
jgi:hypothetical protein